MSVFSTSVSFSAGVRRYFCVAVLLLLIPGAIPAQNKKLVIAVEDDAAPWSGADGTGYANEIVRAAFGAVDIEVEFQVVPYARCKYLAVSGNVPACFSMSPSPEFSEDIELSAKPLFTCFAGYFYNVNKPPRVSRPEDLPARTVVGTVIGYEYPPSLESLIKKGIVVPEESTSENLNLKKLAAGRFDFALLNYNETKSPEWLIARADLDGKVKLAFHAGVLRSHIGFSKKHLDGMWARQQFDRGHRLIKANGTLRRIQKEWSQKLARENQTKAGG